MPRPRILSVGQCGYDSGQIGRGFASRYHAEVISVDTHAQAHEQLRSGGFALVMVNRVGDRDGAAGIELIRSIKADPALSEVPVLLVSNYADAQAQAIDEGAVPGFGKADLGTSKERNSIASILAIDSN